MYTIKVYGNNKVYKETTMYFDKALERVWQLHLEGAVVNTGVFSYVPWTDRIKPSEITKIEIEFTRQ